MDQEIILKMAKDHSSYFGGVHHMSDFSIGEFAKAIVELIEKAEHQAWCNGFTTGQYGKYEHG